MRDGRQKLVGQWVTAAFGAETVARLDERAARVVEEALELAQAMGVSRETVDKIVGYVFSRPVGEPQQEAGGVGVTLLALCEASGFSADQAERVELDRVLAKPLDHFKQRQAEKRAAGITPGIRSNDRAPDTRFTWEASPDDLELTCYLEGKRVGFLEAYTDDRTQEFAWWGCKTVRAEEEIEVGIEYDEAAAKLRVEAACDGKEREANFPDTAR